jgi:hypothetical protein
MSKLQKLPLAAITTALLLPVAAVPVPAIAQGGSVSEIIVYGTDPCPRSTDDNVVVCARKPEAERYRIPERMRSSGTYQQRQSWANRATAFETYGKTGINSCSPVGPAGFTGCHEQLIKQAFKEREEQDSGDIAPEE